MSSKRKTKSVLWMLPSLEIYSNDETLVVSRKSRGWFENARAPLALYFTIESRKPPSVTQANQADSGLIYMYAKLFYGDI